MNIINELKRRNVFRVGIAYLIGAWLFTQVADVVLGVVGAPDSAMRAVVAILGLGFIPTVIFAWVYEMTPDGVKKASEIDADESITYQTGKKLNIATMVMVVSAVAFIIFDRYLPGHEEIASDDAVAVVQQDTGEETVQSEQAETIPTNSIAVLPFANRSNEADDLYFTDGVHDDLLTQLAKIHDLTVISRTSVMEYRDSAKNLKEIGAELNVSTILEGGVQKVGDRVRINAQLIEVATDRHLWAETFDRELTAENVFELQSEIARNIVRAIEGELTPEEERLLDEIPTHNFAAYEAYLRGMEIVNRANYARSEEEAARPFFEKAIELDPEYADAHAELANLYGQLYWRGIDTSQAHLENYRQSLQRARALRPDSPMALRAEANYYYRVENNYNRSLELLQEALKRAPGNVDIISDIGLSLRRLGRWEESIDAFSRALRLDPASGFNHSLLLETMSSKGLWQDILDNSVPLEDADRDELDIQITRALAIFNLTGDLTVMERVFDHMNLIGSTDYLDWSADVHFLQRDYDRMIEVLNGPIWTDLMVQRVGEADRLSHLGDAWRLKGDDERARQYYEQLVSMQDEVLASAMQVQVYAGRRISVALARLGRKEEALQLANRLVEENPYENDAIVAVTPVYGRAMVKGLSGDKNGAIEDLMTAFHMEGSFSPTRWQLHLDPNWDFMRDDPRFVELATPVNLIQ
ncbi:MAG TPA: tetratricopeptide repeat protein [Xanthomonadales bacterium]|nr:tetratricopeptide repeat protein [Xanthomonadales bacterium]